MCQPQSQSSRHFEKAYKFLCKVAAYLDVLESMGPLSLVFEKNVLLAHKVIPAVDLSMTNLEELHKLFMMQYQVFKKIYNQ